jgi:hypothetical protein
MGKFGKNEKGVPWPEACVSAGIFLIASLLSVFGSLRLKSFFGRKLQPRHQQLALEDQFFGQIGVEFEK